MLAARERLPLAVFFLRFFRKYHINIVSVNLDYFIIDNQDIFYIL